MLLKIMLLSMLWAHADSTSLGTLKTIDGGADGANATIEIKGDHGTRKGAAGEAILAGDHVVTGHDVTVTLALRDGSEIVVASDSEVSVSEVVAVATRGSSRLGLIRGMLHALVNKIYTTQEPFMIEAGNCAMGVRGTEFVVERGDNDHTTLHTLEGSVAIARTASELRSLQHAVLVKAGHSSAMSPGQKQPTPARAFNPKTLSQYLGTRAPSVAKVIEIHRVARQAAHKSAEDKVVAPKKKAPYLPPKPKRVKAK
ncbi:MAG: FecR domain-containing protein [Deltaproteobacteria bacterium]|nr:FecR domain-containing protein [Deltaproteobacteria bacterium]